MKYPFHLSNDSITIFNGTPKSVKSGHPNFFRIRAALLEGKYELAYQLMDMPSYIQNASNGDFVVKNSVVYYGSLILNDIISQKLISIILDGGVNCEPVKRYVERIIKNPSRNSANELYDFLGYRELPITPEGTVLAWKGVDENLWSVHGNKNTRVLQGKVDEDGKIYNEIGATIEVERICVDDNRDNECSHGLHVGSYDYAKGWGKRLLLVEFDPADAVSVPRDCDFQKLRVCKYKIVAEMTGKDEITKPVVEKSEITDMGVDLGSDKEELSADQYLSTMEGINFNPWDQADAIVMRDELCLKKRINKMEAWDLLKNYRNRMAYKKIYSYIEANGPSTMKQIQSTLKTNGLICEHIAHIVENADTLDDSSKLLADRKILYCDWNDDLPTYQQTVYLG